MIQFDRLAGVNEFAPRSRQLSLASRRRCGPEIRERMSAQGRPRSLPGDASVALPRPALGLRLPQAVAAHLAHGPGVWLPAQPVPDGLHHDVGIQRRQAHNATG